MSLDETKPIKKKQKKKTIRNTLPNPYSNMGRPKHPMDWEKFDALCAEQCTLEDIAFELGLSPDTIETRIRENYNCTFSELFQIKRRPGLMSLRRRMYLAAMGGDTTMMIWLNKKHKNVMDIEGDSEEKQKDFKIKSIDIQFVDDSEECAKEKESLGRKDTD